MIGPGIGKGGVGGSIPPRGTIFRDNNKNIESATRASRQPGGRLGESAAERAGDRDPAGNNLQQG